MADVIILSGTHINQPQASRPVAINKMRPIFRTAGPYVIAHHLRKNNISVQVIDYIQFLSDTQLISLIKKFLSKDKNKSCILGISTTFLQPVDNLLPSNVVDAIKNIKLEYSNLKIVAGGAHAHHLWMKDNYIDYSIFSYSEDVALELFNGILGKTPLPHDFKLNTKILRDNVNFDIVQSDFRFVKEDCIRPNESLPLEISRGCIFKCKFCRYPHIGKKKNDYIRCIDQIRAELIHNYETFGTTNYYVLDDTFNETPEKVKAFYDMTQTLPFKINWCAYIRADLIHRFPETAMWLKDSGLIGAFFGIETFHPEASNLIGKAWSGKHGKDFILELKNNIWGDDVIITLSLILGIPPETWEDILETQQWIVDNKIDSWTWHSLAINGNPNKSNDKSEFEKDPTKYGFTFPNPANLKDWHHNSITKKQVDEWYNNAETLFDKSIRLGSWNIIEILNYFDKEVAMSDNFKKNFFKEINDKRTAWNALYIKMLEELPDAR
jgi:hypothetical protein